VHLLLEVAGTGSARHVEWPAEKKAIDIGSFYADSAKFRAATGWQPRVPLREGLARTVAYYRAHLPHYLDPGSAGPVTS
jgi:UDP-glucose 4-epimerase